MLKILQNNIYFNYFTMSVINGLSYLNSQKYIAYSSNILIHRQNNV